MKLIIFDIDGTLLNSTSIDDSCLIRTFNDLFSIQISDDEWIEIKNNTSGTDIELTKIIFELKFKRKPDDKEIERIKKHFHQLLIFSFESRKDAFIEIDGAGEIFNFIRNNKDYITGISTGSWKLSALIKLRKINIIPNGFPFSHADRFEKRVDIIKDTINQAKENYDIRAFDRIIYIGDGIWDLNATKQLGIDFIGIDSKKSNILKKNGATIVLENYTDKNIFLNYIS